MNERFARLVGQGPPSPAISGPLPGCWNAVAKEGIVKVLGSANDIDESLASHPDWLSTLKVLRGQGLGIK